MKDSHGADDGCIRIGSAVYRHIIIPKGAFIPQDTQKVLNHFIEAGARVSCGLSDLTLVIQVDGTVLRAMHRKAENAELFYLFREYGENGEYVIHLSSHNAYMLDLINGKLKRFETENGILKLSLAIGETAVILLTGEVLSAENKKEFGKNFEIPNRFEFRKEIELTCNGNGFEKIKHADKKVPVNLGDWAYMIGSAYSGSTVYETSFMLPDEIVCKEGEIDLGDVHFTAQVYLNERQLGTALMPPYRLKIPCGVLDKKNILKVVVHKIITAKQLSSERIQLLGVLLFILPYSITSCTAHINKNILQF